MLSIRKWILGDASGENLAVFQRLNPPDHSTVTRALIVDANATRFYEFSLNGSNVMLIRLICDFKFIKFVRRVSLRGVCFVSVLIQW